MENKTKNELRLAVIQRIANGQLHILSVGTGISEEKLKKFAKKNEINRYDLMVLEAMA